MNNIEHYVLLKKSDIENERLDNIMNEFSRSFLLYRGKFNQNPDTITFSGHYGKKLCKILTPIFSSTFSIKYVDTFTEEVQFASETTPVKKMTNNIGENTTDLKNALELELTDGLIPIADGGSSIMFDYLNLRVSSFSATIEKNEDTIMIFSIDIIDF